MAVVRSAFRSQTFKSTSVRVRALLEVELLKKCAWLLREAHFGVKMSKALQSWSTLVSCVAQKVHVVVAPSAFPSQHVKSTLGSERFWKFSCSKSARGCGAKHMSKSKWQKRHMFALLLDIHPLSFLAVDSAPWQKPAKREGFAAVSNMHFAWQARYKRHLHQTFLRWTAFD